ncbi:hypothetical protein M5689_008118 [Euphorbia peplus]|nr:hypothetical protein M5689_008118 [Euphorbia peplus]
MNKRSKYPFVEVFSLQSSSWSKREISKSFTYELQQKKSIYLRNRLHWIGRHFGSYVIESIVYFDMVEERLDRVNVPYKSVSIFKYKDSIAMIDYERNLWVMEDYNGMQSSWNKFKLPKFKHLDIEKSSFCYCCFTRDGKILIQPFELHGGLRTYDLEDGYVKNVEIQGDNLIFIPPKNSGACFHASPYVESLVSPRWFD